MIESNKLKSDKQKKEREERYKRRNENIYEYLSNTDESDSNDDKDETSETEVENKIYNMHWIHLCMKFDLNPNHYKLITTNTDGTCLFHSFSIAYSDFFNDFFKDNAEDYKINFFKKIVADTFLDKNNEEASNVLTTWNLLYTMAVQENDREMIQHYGHMKCLKDVPENELLSDENRKKVYSAIMNKNFLGEEYCLKIFEKKLKLKIILMNPIKRKIETIINDIDAEYLLLLYYNNYHYQIISYKNNYIFELENLHDDIKNMLIQNGIDFD